MPTSQPIPRASFTSPNPIARPFEKNQRKKNGADKTIPERIAGTIIKPGIVKAFQKTDNKEKAMKG